MNLDKEKEIKGLVLQMLSSDQGSITTEQIASTVAAVVQMQRVLKRINIDEDINEAVLVREIETLCNVYVPMIVTLEDQREHQPWLPDRRSEISWNFWQRYRRFQEQEAKLSFQGLRRLDEVSDEILKRLEDPQRPGPWDRRGMVVGQVQSGKTSNYIALICKAADAGYKLIIVLAGIHNSLRSQTQLRLDEGFLGFDTQRRGLYDPNNYRLGVGQLKDFPFYPVNSLTNGSEKGDFNLKIARQVNLTIGGSEPLLLVVKKHTTVLKNLLNWVDYQRSNEQGSLQSATAHKSPVLIIDDEADNASININPITDQNGKIDPEADPSITNGLIRDLLNKFERSVYIGYTATPFANIFISDQAAHEKYGEDLFPRSFIINLQPPTNYFGPARLFGLNQEVAEESLEAKLPNLPLIRPVDDHSTWIPDKHKKNHIPGPLPDSLKEAMRAFILTCAARMARGQDKKHNSMLIHVTKFVDVQSRIYDQVKEELGTIQLRLAYGDGKSSVKIEDELADLWQRDFIGVMQQLQETDSLPVIWEDVRPFLHKAASKIEIRKINGTAADTLQYIEHPLGLSVICIGGDKLSRGLTLEGLSISYYLRSSKMYDTLMQMGRWFGYRPGYMDLCRLYTTTQLINWYRYISMADEELRRMFEDMAAQDRTPADFGLGVRTHPDGLIITAASKMRASRTLRVSYSEKITETIDFYRASAINRHNEEALKKLIGTLSGQQPTKSKRNDYLWSNVSVEIILDFLLGYQTHENARKAQAQLLMKYIEARNAEQELTEWTVALISNSSQIKASKFTTIAGFQVGFTMREDIDPHDNEHYRIRRLVSPQDEWLDLSDEDLLQATSLAQNIWNDASEESRRGKSPEGPSGVAVRRTRSRARGLLLLYILENPRAEAEEPVTAFAISFPTSQDGDKASVEYKVNNVYWQQEFGDEL